MSTPVVDVAGLLAIGPGIHHYVHLKFIIKRTCASSLGTPGLHHFTDYLPYICHALSSIPQAVLTMCFMSRCCSCLLYWSMFLLLLNSPLAFRLPAYTLQIVKFQTGEHILNNSVYLPHHL